MEFNTIALHEGYKPDSDTKSRAVPIYMTTAYSFDSTEYARSLFALEQPGNIYSRLSNPTCDILEKRVAALEGGVGALATSSGHAAEFMTMLALASAGDEIVSSSTLYGGTHNMFVNTLGKLGITVHFVDVSDPENFARAVTDKTRAFFLETVGNPNANIADIRAVADIAHANGIPLIVDSTMTTPYLIRPFEHGADIVIHSTTKFLCGNGEAMGGLVVDSGKFPFKGNPRFPEYNNPDPSYHGVIFADVPGGAAFITKLRAHILRDVGACQSPFNAWLTLNGVETLALRMQRHCENAQAVAEFLERHPAVERVNYPGLASSPYHALCEKYYPHGAGAVFTFEIRGGRAAGAKFIDGLDLVSRVANLGDSRTLVSHPATTTHSQLSAEELREGGIGEGTVRLSVGIEEVGDIIADLSQALDASQK